MRDPAGSRQGEPDPGLFFVRVILISIQAAT